MAAKFDFDKIRNKFAASSNKSENLPNNYYPFFKMKPDQSARIRFLPDLNENNEWGFLQQKAFHNLFINGQRKAVPCLTNYGHQPSECPICALSKEYYDKGDKKNGSAFWRKYQYIAQVLVIEDPLPVENGEPNVGKVKLVSLGNSLFKIIEDAIKTRELGTMPFLYKGGTDFIIKQTKQGENNNYVLSRFARNSTDLDDKTIEVVESQLIDLSTVLPKNPGVDKLRSMLESAITGVTVNTEDHHAVEHNLEARSSEESAPVIKTVSKVDVQQSAVVEEQPKETKASNTNIDAEAILARIKNRG